jgi:hypothetical protein
MVSDLGFVRTNPLNPFSEPAELEELEESEEVGELDSFDWLSWGDFDLKLFNRLMRVCPCTPCGIHPKLNAIRHTKFARSRQTAGGRDMVPTFALSLRIANAGFFCIAPECSLPRDHHHITAVIVVLDLGE